MKLNEQVEKIIHSMTKRYTKAMLWNIDDRFPHNILSILDAFSIFNLDNILPNTTSSEFSVYGHIEINVLSNQFFANEGENKDTFIEEWESFKFDLLSMRKKWVSLKENLSINNLKQQHPSTEWALK